MSTEKKSINLKKKIFKGKPMFYSTIYIQFISIKGDSL